MNHTTDLTDISDIYDAIQMGEIPSVKMGDTINGRLLIVDAIGNFIEIDPDASYFIFTETIRNKSAGNTFVDRYVSTRQQPYGPGYAHLETVSVESSPITL